MFQIGVDDVRKAIELKKVKETPLPLLSLDLPPKQRMVREINSTHVSILKESLKNPYYNLPDAYVNIPKLSEDEGSFYFICNNTQISSLIEISLEWQEDFLFDDDHPKEVIGGAHSTLACKELMNLSATARKTRKCVVYYGLEDDEALRVSFPIFSMFNKPLFLNNSLFDQLFLFQ